MEFPWRHGITLRHLGRERRSAEFARHLRDNASDYAVWRPRPSFSLCTGKISREKMAGMSAGRPLVSVCIPTYRQARFLPETLRSALTQDYPNLEVLVSDDASPDETPAVLAAFQDPRLKVMRQTRNLGRDANCNAAIRASGGTFVLKLDSDDLIAPDHVSRQVELLEAHPSVGFAHCACELIDAEGRHLGFERSVHGSFVRSGREEFLRYALGSRAVNIVTMRRSAYDRVGGYEEGRFYYCGDWAMHLKMLLAGDVAYNDHVIASYRVHGEAKEDVPVRQAEDLVRLLMEFLPGIWPEEFADQRDRTLQKARHGKAVDLVLGAGVHAPAVRDAIIRTALELDTGFGVRLRARLAILVPRLVRRSLVAKLALRQRVKRLLYREPLRAGSSVPRPRSPASPVRPDSR